MISLQEAATHFEAVKWATDGGFDCRCSVHKPDNHPSAHIKMGNKGLIARCKACGATGREIFPAAGISLRDVFIDNENQSTPGERYVKHKYPQCTLYDYHSFIDGSYDHTKIRYYPEWAKGGKKFANGYWEDNGRFNDRKGCLNDRKPRTAIFGNVARIKKCIAEKKVVYYCEGEKDTQTMQKLGYPAFTQGSCTTFYPELAPHLKGIRLIILADNDTGGQNGAKKLRELLLPYAESIKVITPCTDFAKSDVTDYFENHDKSDFEKLIQSAVTDTNTAGRGVLTRQSGDKADTIQLERTSKGAPLGTIGNFLQVFKNDARLMNMFRYNQMTDNIEVHNAWWVQFAPTITDTDVNNIRLYLEQTYGLAHEKNVIRAIDILAHENSYHPVRQYLNDLPEWDGSTDYISELLPRYLGAEQTPYTAAVTHLIFDTAIARVFTPGTKVDQMAVLIDKKQGSGKSTMVRLIATMDDWYTDTLQNLDNAKDTHEKMSGRWIIELGEMLATTNAKTVESIKSFLSRQSDAYRTPYERFSRTIYRQNIFIGTSNDINCLPPDLTGNRRFLPIRCDWSKAQAHPLQNEQETRAYIKNCWIQAMTLYRRGENRLTLPPELEAEAQKEQEVATPEDAMVGQLQEWLDNTSNDTVCSMMLFYEAIHDNNENAPRPKAWELREISQIMNTRIQGWQRYPTSDSKKRFVNYGKQRAWQRIPGFITVDAMDKMPFE